jgi:exodeoxyribonuclease V alpha subunit
MNTDSSEQIIRGVVQRVTFRNPENGYSVMQVSVADQRQRITVVGTALQAKVGTHLVARGYFQDHPKFGRQLNASSITETSPTTAEGLEHYLGSGEIKGIGPKTAARMVEEFGTEVMEVIHRDPDRLRKLIGKKKAQLIITVLSERQGNQEVLQFLIENHVSTNLAKKILDKYKERAIEVLKRDPYVLARDMRGVGFQTADKIALKLGLAPDSPQRLKAGLHHALEKAAEDGHCYLPAEQLAMRARSLLGLVDEHDLLPELEQLVEEGYLIHEEEAYYLSHLFRAETAVAQFITSRCHAIDEPDISDQQIIDSLAQTAAKLSLTYSPEQQQAVHSAAKFPLSIITGGPGCGKTTIVRAIKELFAASGKRLLLAAPTGRAAQRLSQVCDHPASTIHRLLRYDPVSGHFVHGAKDPLIADAVIVDEASMLDILLARDLFAAIASHTRLILVGDKDQLPSVGPGRVFGDLVSVPEIRTIALSHLFRRSSHSSITTVAHMVNSGLMPDIPTPDGITKSDAYFLPKSDPEEAAVLIERLVADQLPKKFQINADEITVLTPTNRGPLGTIALNQRLQAKLNPPELAIVRDEISVHDTIFRVGDRVCQRVNNYQIDPIGVFNGDPGVIYSINAAKRELVVEMWDGRLVKYEDGAASQLSLAYAITVHRSQGSEMACVVLALHESQFALLERQLIYTAMTRAKRLLVVVGSKRALSLSVKRTNALKRCTKLRERVRSSVLAKQHGGACDLAQNQKE